MRVDDKFVHKVRGEVSITTQIQRIERREKLWERNGEAGSRQLERAEYISFEAGFFSPRHVPLVLESLHRHHHLRHP